MLRKNKVIVAIMYDFDRTLCDQDMQNYALIPSLGMTPEKFWGETDKFAKKTQCESILSYMFTVLVAAKQKNIKVTSQWLKSFGKSVKLYPGVKEWFKRINKYAASKGIQLEHYVISSGSKEIIEGTEIANEFKKIYGCEYLYDKKGEAIWPKLAINYTQKTQYYFRISKGIIDVSNDYNVNAKAELRIKKRNMIYIGDGMTDVACMTLCKDKGGKAIAIYSDKKNKTIQELINEDRVNFAAFADYREGKVIDKTVKLILDGIEINEKLKSEEAKK